MECERVADARLPASVVRCEDVELVRAGLEHAELVQDLADTQLRGDAWFPRSQVKTILTRVKSTCWIVVVEGEVAGLAIEYDNSVLHNLVLVPWARARGVGSFVLAKLRPDVVRSKENMRAGNPTPFYERNGYAVHARDPERPHIALLKRSGDSPVSPAGRTGEEEEMLVSMLSKWFGVPVAPRSTCSIEHAPVKSVDAAETLSGQPQKLMIEVPLDEYEELRTRAQKYSERAEKQRGYQSKRYAKKQKLRSRTGEQSAPVVHVKTD